VESLKRLPGIGEKSATRLAFYLLGAADSQVQTLSEAIGRLKQEIVLCEQCFNLTDHSPCEICRDPKRNAALLCVVEEPADLAAIEKSASFDGHYHVLGGAFSPIDGVGPDELRV
jgi:recombination protein RecR